MNEILRIQRFQEDLSAMDGELYQRGKSSICTHKKTANTVWMSTKLEHSELILLNNGMIFSMPLNIRQKRE